MGKPAYSNSPLALKSIYSPQPPFFSARGKKVEIANGLSKGEGGLYGAGRGGREGRLGRLLVGGEAALKEPSMVRHSRAVRLIP